MSCGFAVHSSANEIANFAKSSMITRTVSSSGAVDSSSDAFQTHPTPARLGGTEYYTVDRCVMYTYYGKGMKVGDALQVDQWKTSWKNAGWKPVVLDERHAQIHPRYASLKNQYAQLPLGSDMKQQFESESSLLRYVALAAVGGGYMTEPDVFNVNLPPPPQCDYLPNQGQFTTHDVFIPALVSGDASSCLHVAEAFATAPPTDIKHATGADYLNDVVFFSYFYQYNGIIKTMKTGLNDPTKVRTPPCDTEGVEYAPLLFHASPLNKLMWKDFEFEAGVGEAEEGNIGTEKKSSKSSKSKESSVKEIIDPYAVREGRDGSVEGIQSSLKSNTVTTGNKDTEATLKKTQETAEVMRKQYEKLRKSTIAFCKPIQITSTREYAQTYFPDKPTPLQRSYNQEYLCDISAGESFCDATGEEIELGFQGIVGKKGKKAKAVERDVKGKENENEKSEKTSSKASKDSSKETKKVTDSSSKNSKGKDSSSVNVNSGVVDKSERLLTKYLKAGM